MTCVISYFVNYTKLKKINIYYSRNFNFYISKIFDFLKYKTSK